MVINVSCNSTIAVGNGFFTTVNVMVVNDFISVCINCFDKSAVIIIRASLKTRLIKEKADRYDSCKETFRRRAAALRGRLTQQMSCIAVFSQKGFLEMPYKQDIVIFKKHRDFDAQITQFSDNIINKKCVRQMKST